MMIGDINETVTRSKSAHYAHFTNSVFVVSFEPHNVGRALSDSSWVNTMHEELENFERNQVWVLIEPPPNIHTICTK